MMPSPPSNSSFADNFRFRSRRQRHVTPYDPAQNTTPTQTNVQAQVTPLVHEEDGDGDGEAAGDELSSAEVEDEGDEVEEGDEADIDDETHDVEEEGGIEEGWFYTSLTPACLNLRILCSIASLSNFAFEHLILSNSYHVERVYTQICLL